MRYLLTADLYNPFVEKGIKFPVADEVGSEQLVVEELECTCSRVGGWQ